MSIVRAWKILTWKHWAWATAIPVLVSITMPLQDFDTNRYWAYWRILFHTPWFLLISYVFLIAIALAESSVPPEVGPSAARYAAALGVASLVCIAALGTFPELVRIAPRHVVAGQLLPAKANTSLEAQEKARRLAAILGLGFLALIHAWLASFIYVGLRNSRRAAQALANAEIERAEAQRSLLAAQLVAAHAQVDPTFVLETLANVERAYEDDPARADVLLDEFIAFLRNAIPRLRTDGAAVG